MQRRFVMGLMVAASALPAQAASAAMATKTVEQTIPAAGQVKIANLAGRVVLAPAANGPVKVVAVVNGEGSSPQETQDLMNAMHWVQEHDGTWNLAYPVHAYDAFVYPERLGSMGSHTTAKFRGERVHVYGGARRGVPVLYADLTITVPKGARLKVVEAVGGIRGSNLDGNLYLDTGSGSIKVDGAAGELVADTGSGDVELSQIAGNTKADTGSGDVIIDGIAADKLAIDTGSGDVTVSKATVRELVANTGSGAVDAVDLKLETLKAETGSGDITLKGDLSGARSLDLDTGSGDVEVIGGPAFEFDLTTDVGSGEVSIGYTDAELRRDRHEIIGARRGSGETKVLVDTGSGSVRVAPSTSR